MSIPHLTKAGEVQRFVHGHNAFDPPPLLVDPVSLCWLWTGGSNERGYGRINRAGKMRPAHRWFYERLVGPIPPGHQIDHLCRTPRCCNPDHLEPVTPTENVRRSRVTPLSPEQVTEIKAEGERLLQGRRGRRPMGSRQVLAKKYGVDVKTIHNIWAGATWAK